MSRLSRAFEAWVRSSFSLPDESFVRTGRRRTDEVERFRQHMASAGPLPPLVPMRGDDLEADPVSDALVMPVQAFVVEVGQALDELAGRAGRADGKARQDVALEAAAIAAGIIDADVNHTDEELRAYLVALGPLLFGTAYASPGELRGSGMLAGKRSFLNATSPLFELLVDADANDGGNRSWRYYRAALDLAHASASCDVHTSQAELEAIGRFRAVLLQRIKRAGVPRPEAAFFGLHPADLGQLPPPAASTGANGGGVGGAAGAPAATADAAPAVSATADDPAAREAAMDLEPPRPLEDLLAELDELVGLDSVKAEVKRVTDLLTVQRLREERGLPSHAQSRHLIFTGNPGTGKTTVARLLAQIYRTLEIVAIGHLVETDRSKLVAGYVGQTAERTAAVIETALDGVLLVDEAYALARGGEKDFGREAIDTLVKMMEDNRERLVVIAAGYPTEMQAFIDANPGLDSRFPRTIHFPDYDDEELVAILTIIASSRHYELDEGALEAARAWFSAVPRGEGFGNGRLARNLLEAAMARHASRLVTVAEPTDEQLLTLMAEDVAGVELPA